MGAWRVDKNGYCHRKRVSMPVSYFLVHLSSFIKLENSSKNYCSCRFIITRCCACCANKIFCKLSKYTFSLTSLFARVQKNCKFFSRSKSGRTRTLVKEKLPRSAGSNDKPSLVRFYRTSSVTGHVLFGRVHVHDWVNLLCAESCVAVRTNRAIFIFSGLNCDSPAIKAHAREYN